MTAAHLFFALLTRAYILVAIRLEEGELPEIHPEHAGYRQRVPMLIPPHPRARPVTPVEEGF